MDAFPEMIKDKRSAKGYSMRTLSRLLLEKEGIKASRTVINFVEKVYSTQFPWTRNKVTLMSKEVRKCQMQETRKR